MPASLRTAAIYDVHGNLPALEAVVSAARDANVDRIVVGGDVLPGPMPVECLDVLFGLEVETVFIRGNGESAVLAEREGRDSGLGPYRPMLQWVGAQLTDAHVRAIAAWPQTVRFDDVLFCHATPRDENEFVDAGTPESSVAAIFEAAGAPVVGCGHTHGPYDRRAGRVRIVNAGSVGMPFKGSGADWLLVIDHGHHGHHGHDGDHGEVRPQHTPYDLHEAARRIRTTAYPGAADFADADVLRGHRN